VWRRRAGTGVIATLVLTLIGAAVSVSTAAAAAAAQEEQVARLAGEFGLVVFSDGDSLRVHWLTEVATPGAVEVVDARSGRLIGQQETPAGFSHASVLDVERSQDLVLRYGSAVSPDAMHETRVSIAPVRRAAVSVPAVDSLYLIGDTHGMHDALVRGLRNAGLVDQDLRWTGGRKHLVFAGDLLDRGPDVMRNVWLIYRLEREAAEAGGAVHTILGNHEIMVMLGDLRYVHPKERQIAALHGIGYDDLFDVRRSVLGRWLASKPALLRIGRVLIAHGGVDDAFVGASLQQIDAMLGRYIAEDLFYNREYDSTAAVAKDSAAHERRYAFFWSDNSLFWHRDYVQTDTLQAKLDRVLRHFRSDVLVVGHSATSEPEARYGGRLITAHTTRYGEDVVLLVRARGGVQRYHIGGRGEPTPF
jgi:hypothetical protein